jgi:hypothetical protein
MAPIFKPTFLLRIDSTGYPGHESQHRAAMLKVLGEEKQEYFFDKFLEYFFMEDDAKFFASLGLNCIRLPFNYRHFEDDMNPRVLKESGFKHLDRVIALVCALPTRSTNLTAYRSVQSITSTLSSTCTQLQAGTILTGIPTIPQITQHFGITKTTKIERYGYGNN